MLNLPSGQLVPSEEDRLSWEIETSDAIGRRHNPNVPVPFRGSFQVNHQHKFIAAMIAIKNIDLHSRWIV